MRRGGLILLLGLAVAGLVFAQPRGPRINGQPWYPDGILVGPNARSVPGAIVGSATINFGNPVAVPGCVESAQTVTGAALGDGCVASSGVAVPATMVLGCVVTGSNQVTFRVCQFSGSPTEPDGSGTTYRAYVLPAT